MEIRERRRKPRQRVLKQGRVSFGFSDSVVECIISNEADLGVMIETETPVNFPEHVKIQINNSGVLSAVVRWTLGTKAGLEFVQSKANSAGIEHRKKIQLLKAENIRSNMNMLVGEIFLYSDESEMICREIDIIFEKLNRKISQGQKI